jgi:hypothetical protein
MLFYSLALCVFYIAIEKNRPRYFILFYVLFYLAMSERLIAVLLIPVIFIYIITIKFLPFEPPPGLNARNVLILSTPIILFLLYEFYLFATTGDYIFASDLDLLAPPIDNPIRILIIVAFSIGIPILCFGFFSGMSLLFKWDRAGLFILIAATLPPVVIALASPFFFIVERYAFVALLFWITLAAIGIKSIFAMAGSYRIALALGILSILLVDAAGDNLLYYQINHGNRLEWREAAEHIRREINDGDVIISTRAPLAAYYLDKDVLDFQGLSPEDLELINSPIWFIMDYPGVWHGRHDTKVWIETHAQLLQFSYLRTREEYTLLIYYLDLGMR